MPKREEERRGSWWEGKIGKELEGEKRRRREGRGKIRERGGGEMG